MDNALTEVLTWVFFITPTLLFGAMVVLSIPAMIWELLTEGDEDDDPA